MKQLLHLVARTRFGAKPLRSRAACADLWNRLTPSFETLACALMPNHVHLLAEAEPDHAIRKFSHLLSAFRRRHAHLNFEWETLPRPEKVQYDKRHIARTIRYIHLNPSRDALCNDPLEWEWSTHRDWIGAVADPLVDTTKWGRAVGWSGPQLARRLHEYVCTDPSVMPQSAPPNGDRFIDRHADASLSQIAAAVTLIYRTPRANALDFSPKERRIAVAAAKRWTDYRAPRLARWLGCHPTQVRRLMRAARKPNLLLKPSELKALALTLSDPRLQVKTGR